MSLVCNGNLVFVRLFPTWQRGVNAYAHKLQDDEIEVQISYFYIHFCSHNMTSKV